MKKILILTYYYPPDLAAGSFRAEALVKALSELYGDEIAIDILTTMPNRYETHDSGKPLAREVSGNTVITRIALPQPGKGQASQALRFSRFGWAATRFASGKTYDLVFATSSRLMTATLGRWIAQRCKARLYLDIRDIFVETITDLKHGKLAAVPLKGLDLVERWTINGADKISVVSGGFIPYFQKRCGELDLDVSTNGIDEMFLAEFPDMERGDTTRELNIVYAGNIGDGQGLHRIVPALARELSNVARFHIVGDGGRLSDLRTAIEKHGVTNVTLTPPVSRAEVADIYRNADVLFLHLNDVPAFRRVIPSKLFEYAATGKPILAGVSGYCAEFIGSEIPNVEVFEPCNMVEAKNAFERLHLASAPRAEFVEKYKREVIMKKLARLVFEAADKGR
jgi:glycosyltransferase involved in cell wall biosynthesis